MIGRIYCAVIALSLTTASLMASEPKGAGQPLQERTLNVQVQAPGDPVGVATDILLADPDIGAPPRGPDAPVGFPPGSRNSQVLVGGMMGASASDNAPPEIMLQQRMQALQKQQEKLAQEYQATMKAMQKSLPRAAQLDIERQELQHQLATAKGQIAELRDRQEHVMIAPLPANAVIRAFKLQYVKPDDIGQAIHNITGGGGPRIAIDERTNTLLIAGDDKQTSVAESLIQKLDQPSGEQKGNAAETLQVRVVWVLDIHNTEGREAEPPFLSPQVVEGLYELGFTTPRVMCQQVTTLTLEKDNRRGEFHFQIPVLVEGDTWEFEGQGEISSAMDDRYALQFNLNFRLPNNTKNSQLGGSILTPLAHYNVMGTSTFVGMTPANANSPEPYQEQHLSAFIVYLDRAREFGDKAPVPGKEAAPKR